MFTASSESQVILHSNMIHPLAVTGCMYKNRSHITLSVAVKSIILLGAFIQVKDIWVLYFTSVFFYSQYHLLPK